MDIEIKNTDHPNYTAKVLIFIGICKFFEHKNRIKITLFLAPHWYKSRGVFVHTPHRRQTDQAPQFPSFPLDWTKQPQICQPGGSEPGAALSELRSVCGVLGRDDQAPGSQERTPTWLEEQGSGHIPCWALAPCPPFCWCLLGTLGPRQVALTAGKRGAEEDKGRSTVVGVRCSGLSS